MQIELFDDLTRETPRAPKRQTRADQNKEFQAYTLAIHLALALSEAQKTHVPFDKGAFCEKMGSTMVDVDAAFETLLSAQEKIEQKRHVYEASLEDKGLELTGLPLPSEETKLHFDSDLEDSTVFEVFDTEKTVRQFSKLLGGSSDKEIHEYGILAFVEDLFLDAFDEEVDLLLMNAFFWILFYKGKEWIPVRSYAIEMLKLFPYAIQKHFLHATSFIEDFSLFTRRRLATRGICSLKARPSAWEVKNGLFAIKGTDAFYSLLQVRKEDDLG